jgi:two-component system response regulator AtoC
LRIDLPPIRQRKDDILPLAELFLRKFRRKYNVDKEFREEEKDALLGYDWPGNVRELRQLIERVTYLAKGAVIEAADINLPQMHETSVSASEESRVRINIPDDGINLEEIEREIILSALRSSGGNVSKAAGKPHIGREPLRHQTRNIQY